MGHLTHSFPGMSTDTAQMKARLELDELFPEAYRAMCRFDSAAAKTTLEPGLLDLLKTRASQLNGCAYCLDMHTKDARAGGESEMRLYALNAWRETAFFSERERAALELTEAITLLAESRVPDEVWERAAKHFDDEELAALVFAVTVINSWNRLAVATRMVPGTYEQ
jgi:AhpD family alkylhydroperoxidase